MPVIRWSIATAALILFAASCGGSESSSAGGSSNRSAVVSAVVGSLPDSAGDDDRCFAEVYLNRLPDEYINFLSPDEWESMWGRDSLRLRFGRYAEDPAVGNFERDVIVACFDNNNDVSDATAQVSMPNNFPALPAQGSSETSSVSDPGESTAAPTATTTQIENGSAVPDEGGDLAVQDGLFELITSATEFTRFDKCPAAIDPAAILDATYGVSLQDADPYRADVQPRATSSAGVAWLVCAFGIDGPDSEPTVSFNYYVDVTVSQQWVVDQGFFGTILTDWSPYRGGTYLLEEHDSGDCMLWWASNGAVLRAHARADESAKPNCRALEIPVLDELPNWLRLAEN